jgi:hypothetical protein
VIICRNDAAEAEKLHYEILNNTEDILRPLSCHTGWRWHAPAR